MVILVCFLCWYPSLHGGIALFAQDAEQIINFSSALILQILVQVSSWYLNRQNSHIWLLAAQLYVGGGTGTGAW